MSRFPRFMNCFALLVLPFALFVALCPGIAWAAGEDAESAGDSQDAPIQSAIASCITGLFAGWDVEDASAFYASDMLEPSDSSCGSHSMCIVPA